MNQTVPRILDLRRPALLPLGLFCSRCCGQRFRAVFGIGRGEQAGQLMWRRECLRCGSWLMSEVRPREAS